MIRTSLAALGLCTLAGVLAAAPPSRDVKQPNPVAKPRAGAFITNLDPLSGPVLARSAEATSPININDHFDLIVLARHRPIKIRLTVGSGEKPMVDRWRAALKNAYTYFDRDGDGELNGHETRYIFSDTSLAVLMQNSYYGPNPQDQPSINRLDQNGDRRVSFEEFIAYYRQSKSFLLKAQPPTRENNANAQMTEALYKLLDLNGDGKLTRDEVLAVEAMLPTRDADEDECLSMAELMPIQNGGVNRGAVQIMQPPNGTPVPTGPQITMLYEANRIPGTLTQRLQMQYDTDGDLELSRNEIGFDPITFDRLDANQNGTLDGEELDGWRSGEADLEATIIQAAEAEDCRARVLTDVRVAEARGFRISQTEPGRIVIQAGRQNVELSAFVPTIRNQRPTLKGSYGPSFQFAAGAKGFVAESDLYGQNAAQLQLIRVAFDPADHNSDGKLTKDEYERYLDAQQAFVDLSLSLIPGMQTPSLFQLLDANRDGKLGVRELRTGWDRLIALEPGGTTVVTRAAIQPTVHLRLVRSIERGYVNQIAYQNPTGVVAIPSKGPLWFRKMDRNGDGDLSHTEFLGSRDEFKVLDADHDDLISLDEAEVYDKKVRNE